MSRDNYRGGGGQRQQRFNDQAETTNEEMVTIRAKPKFKTAKAWAFGKGRMEPDPRNPGQQREVVGFVAFASATDNGDGTFSMPRWLVEREGLECFAE